MGAVDPRTESLGEARALALFAAAYGTLHHQGFVLGRLGEVGDSQTRWADWLDLGTPFLVLGTAAWALLASGAVARVWLMFAVGAVLYTEGHGIHLAANSVSNVEPSDVVHLWDEIVGHYLWYAGVSLVFAAVVKATAEVEAGGWIPPLFAVVVGGTFATNALEGSTALMSLLVSVAFLAWSGRLPAPSVVRVRTAAATAFVMIGGYGVIHRGFPAPSDIGWNLL